MYRPSHADFTYDAKYGFRDHRGGGRASARETVGRVAAGAVARQLLDALAGVEVIGWVSQVHEIEADVVARGRLPRGGRGDAHPLPRPRRRGARMVDAIEAARRAGRLPGRGRHLRRPAGAAGPGRAGVRQARGRPGGGLLSLPAAKGFEIGSGFAGTRLTGLEHNDPFVPTPPASTRPRTATNRSGGVQGGISNGEDVVVRVAFKPTATIASPQATVTRDGDATTLAAHGRHDPCVLPRAVPLVEAMICLVLADHLLRQRAVDVLPRGGGDRDWR